MAITLQEVEGFLTELGLKYRKGPSEDELAMGFGTKSYRDKNGQQGLMIVLKLEENGEYLKVYAPLAFYAKGDHASEFLRACMMMQWRTKLIQFEYDEGDGEVRPIIEFPVEDSKLTKQQVGRCVFGLAQLVDEFYPTLKRALDEGIVEFPDDPLAKAEVQVRTLRTLLQRLQSSTDPADRSQVPLIEALITQLEGSRGQAGPPKRV